MCFFFKCWNVARSFHEKLLYIGQIFIATQVRWRVKMLYERSFAQKIRSMWRILSMALTLLSVTDGEVSILIFAENCKSLGQFSTTIDVRWRVALHGGQHSRYQKHKVETLHVETSNWNFKPFNFSNDPFIPGTIKIESFLL